MGPGESSKNQNHDQLNFPPQFRLMHECPTLNSVYSFYYLYHDGAPNIEKRLYALPLNTETILEMYRNSQLKIQWETR